MCEAVTVIYMYYVSCRWVIVMWDHNLYCTYTRQMYAFHVYMHHGASLSKLKAYVDVCGYVQLLVAGHGVTHLGE